METKICTTCGKELPATNEYFAKAKLGKYGLESKCKKCKHEYAIEYNKKNKDKKEVMAKKYYEQNKDKIKEQSKIYKEKNKEKIKANSQNYYSKNIDKYKENGKKYRENNKEKIKESHKKYYENNKKVMFKKLDEWRKGNKDKVKGYYKKHRDTHKEERAINQQIRRSRKLSLPNSLTMKQWKEIKAKFNNKCCYCNNENPLEMEHFIPLSKGGEYTSNNIIPACKNCNNSKNNKDFKEWYPKQEFYSKEREQFILKYLGYKEDSQQLRII